MVRRQLFPFTIVAMVIAVALGAFSARASAQGVIPEWKTIQAPPAPELKTVTINTQKTALLVMDFNDAFCSAASQHAVPSCVRAVPRVKRLLDEARAHHMLVVFTRFPHMAPIVKELTPMHGESVLVGHDDKFIGTDLHSILKRHGITTVITTGMVANGAVLYTAYGAANFGYKVIVPVDAMPGRTPYAEQSTIWGVMHDPGLGQMSTVTSVGRIRF